ncbi:MAG: hypothetical protein RJA99_1882, partial [Pseudomonadota bacterium]
PGDGTHEIALTAALPTITGPVVLDATTDDSFAANGNRPAIVIDGGGRAIDGLVLGDGSAASTVRGLLIRHVGGDGLVLRPGAAGSVVVGNWIGALDATGGFASGEGIGGTGLVVDASGARVGGVAVADRNHVAGAAAGGIRVGAASGVLVAGNRVGLALDGATVIGNGGDGIAVVAGTGHSIGGAIVGQGNFVAGSGDDGFSVADGASATLLRNRAWQSGGLGIELGIDDDVPAAPGTAGVSNRPVLTQAVVSGSTVRVVGSLEAVPSTRYRIEFFSSPFGDGDRAEARLRLFSFDLRTDAAGRLDIDSGWTTPEGAAAVAVGDRITATATVVSDGGLFGATSEFASARGVRGLPALSLDTSELFYPENVGPLAIDPRLEVAESAGGSDPITGATVRIDLAGYVAAEDRLGFEPAGGIVGTWRPADAVLELSGAADIETWAQVLRSVHYVNTSEAPSPGSRIVSFTVTDGVLTSATVARTVSPVRLQDAPRPVLDGPVTVIPGSATRIDVLANDREPDGDPMTIVGIVDRAGGVTRAIAAGESVTLASGTVVTLEPDGALTVVQAAGADGVEAFGYRVADGQGNVGTGTVVLATDSDGDGVANRFDLDDDRDSIADAVERAGGRVPVTIGWLIDDAGRLVRVDGLEGEPSAGRVVGTVGRPIADIGMAPDGALWGVDSATGEVGTIDVATAAFTSRGTLPAGIADRAPNALAFDAAGRGYVAGHDTSVVWRFSQQAPAAATPWLDLGSGRATGDLVFAADAAYLAWTDSATSAVQLIEVFVDGAGDPIARRVLGTLGAGTTGLTVDAWGQLYATGPDGSGGQALRRLLLPAQPLAGGTGPIGSIVLTEIAPVPGAIWRGAASDAEGGRPGDPDRDGDGIVDRLDIDSDDDGIVDRVEAQPSAGWRPDQGYDDDVDGLDYAVDASADGADGSIGLVPVDTDRDGTPDVIDTDSDGDGFADATERGDGRPALPGASGDADRDGLRDVFEGTEMADGPSWEDQGRWTGQLGLALVPGLWEHLENAVPLQRDLVFRDINDAPGWIGVPAIAAIEGGTTVVDWYGLGIQDPDSGIESISVVVSDVLGGRFALAGDPSTAITRFTATQLLAGEVLFVDGGDEIPPTYRIAIDDGTQSSAVVAGRVDRTPTNDAPTTIALASPSLPNLLSGTDLVQSVATDAGRSYVLAFDVTPADPGGIATVDVWWRGQRVATAVQDGVASFRWSVAVTGSGGLDVLRLVAGPARVDGLRLVAADTSAIAVPEMSAAGTVVATAAHADPDGARLETAVWSLTDDAGGRFAIDASTGTIVVAEGAVLDHETAASYGIVVRVTDGGGLWFERAVTIAIADANDPPTIASSTIAAFPEDTASAARSVAELFGAGFSDPDAGASLAGVVVTANGAMPSQGGWRYSTDGGTTWFDIGEPAPEGRGLVLSAATRLRFVPAADWSGTPGALSVRGLDDSWSGGFTAGAQRLTVDLAAVPTAAFGPDDAALETSVTPVPDAPVVSVDGPPRFYREGDPDFAVAPDLGLSDVDVGQTLVGATVRIVSGRHPGEDVLAFSGAGEIHVTDWNAATGTLTLAGEASVEQWRDALRAVTYANTSPAPSTTPRTVVFEVTDAAGQVGVSSARQLRVESVPDAPVVTPAGDAPTFTENGVPVRIAAGFTVDDADSTGFGGALLRVRVAENGGADDRLDFDASAGVSVIGGNQLWLAAGGGSPRYVGLVETTPSAIGPVLAVRFAPGTSVADAQAVLRAVSFEVLGDSPSTGSRRIEITLADGEGAMSPVVETQVSVVPAYDPVTLLRNAGLRVATGSTSAFGTANLAFFAPESLPGDVLLRLETAPTAGELRLNGVALAAGEGFTLDDLVRQRVTYRNTVTSAASDTFELVAVEARGETAPIAVSVSIDAVNDAPQWLLPAVVTLVEDAPAVLDDARGTRIAILDDADVGTALRLTVSIDGGARLALGSTVGLVFREGDGVADTTLTVEGTLARLNAALDGLRIEPARDVSGTLRLSLSVDDLGGSGTRGGARTSTAQLEVRVAPVNDLPTLSMPGQVEVLEDDAMRFDAGSGRRIAIDDVEGGGSMRLRLQVDRGTLTLAGTQGLLLRAGTGTGDALVVVEGSREALQAALDGLVFRPPADESGRFALDVLVIDAEGAAAQGRTIIVVAPVDDAPTLSVPTGLSALAGDVLALGDVVQVADVDDSTGTVVMELAVRTGRLWLAQPGGVSTVVSGDGGANGTRLRLEGPLGSVNAALASLRYDAPAGWSGDAVLEVWIAQPGLGSPQQRTVVIKVASAGYGGDGSTGGGSGGATVPTGPAAGPVTTTTPGTTGDVRGAAAEASVTRDAASGALQWRTSAPSAQLARVRAAAASGEVGDARSPLRAGEPGAARVAADTMAGDAGLRAEPGDAPVAGSKRVAADGFALVSISADSISIAVASAAGPALPAVAESDGTLAPAVAGPETEAAEPRGPVLTLREGAGLAGVALTAGVVWWVLSGGATLWLLIATGPIARTFDPLPVLVRDDAALPGDEADALFDGGGGDDDDDDDGPASVDPPDAAVRRPGRVRVVEWMPA